MNINNRHVVKTTCSMLLFIAAVFLSACSTQATLTLRSQPEGAYVTQIISGTQHGITPKTFSYEASALDKLKKVDGCFVVPGFEVRWISGATSKIEQIKLCSTSTADYEITMARNLNAPGLEKDIQFAAQLQAAYARQRLAIQQQQQAKAAQDETNALLRSIASPPRRALNCTSMLVGNMMQTNCY